MTVTRASDEEVPAAAPATPSFADWLPPRERLANALRYAAGLPEAEVARAMGVASGTASATLTSARRKLAVALGDHESDRRWTTWNANSNRLSGRSATA